ncbi:MAG: VWA domain-containing protein [Lactobacillus sp.]|jgi:Ca-activated chloride channel family protein|nr:VWA domain-containing protein [Lactobacillus sp.]
MIKFLYPFMLLLVFVPFIFRALVPAAKGIHGDALKVPFLNDIKNISVKSGKFWEFNPSIGKNFSRPVFWLYVVWFLMCVAAARPQLVGEPIRVKNYGRDILMVMDISTSMLETDFTINNYRITRLNAVKLVAKKFIEKRANDRIGLVLFGSRAYLQAPITFDKKSVEKILMDMEAGMAGNSTAIGDALGLALKYLKDTDNPDRKIIILLTDGENNDGALTMPQAINLAREEGVKIYTIGVGSEKGFASSLLGINLSIPSGLDETSLQEIAKETKGRYFRAESTHQLMQVYNEIDKLEPDNQEENFVQETDELFYIPLLVALLLAMGMVIYVRRMR